MRELSFYEYLNLCRWYGFFTRGDNTQYDKVASLASTLTWDDVVHRSKGFIAVIYMTWICSDVETISTDDVEKALIGVMEELCR